MGWPNGPAYSGDSDGKVKISVITAAYEANDDLDECVASVRSQSHRPIEHILVLRNGEDLGSRVVEKHRRWFSTVLVPESGGLYHALNIGLTRCTGDVIGFLNSDDCYARADVLARVASFMSHSSVQSCYGDLVYVSRLKQLGVVRFWESKPFSAGLFRKGWMPPHPTFFARREVYEQCGGYRTDFAISADYELLLRLFERQGLSSQHIPHVLVEMKTGGVSNRGLKNLVTKSREDLRSWQLNQLGSGVIPVALKMLSKLPQFFKRPKS